MGAPAPATRARESESVDDITIKRKTIEHDWQDNADGSVTIKSVQDVEPYLAAAAAARAEDEPLGRQLTQGEGMHYVGTLPPIVIQMLQDRGFYVSSPERSNMTAEDHQAALLKLFTGEFMALNTSRFKRLV